MMKKQLLVCCTVLILSLTSCETLKNIGLIPTELEMGLGLKDALSQGLFRGFNAFADPNGNTLVRFAFPGEAQKIEKTLRDLGLDKTVDQVTGKFTRAMSSAVSAAKPMFTDAVKKMSIRDAAKILVTDNSHAATDYFKQTMKPDLMVAFRPIVDSTLKAEEIDKEWSNIAGVYNKIPFVNKQLESNMTDFISARAIDVMFTMVANEEEQIRSKYELRKTDLMRKAFTYAEQELKKRMQKN
jgi:ribosomal protein L30/L7E